MTHTRLRIAICALVAIAIPTLASAGKPERDKQKELTPKVAAAKAAIKTACGCNVAIDVKWSSYANADDMFRITNGLDDVVGGAKSHCDDDGEKKVFCSNVNTFEIRYGKDGNAITEGKKIICETYDAGHCAEHQVNRELDKF